MVPNTIEQERSINMAGMGIACKSLPNDDRDRSRTIKLPDVLESVWGSSMRVVSDI